MKGDWRRYRSKEGVGLLIDTPRISVETYQPPGRGVWSLVGPGWTDECYPANHSLIRREAFEPCRPRVFYHLRISSIGSPGKVRWVQRRVRTTWSRKDNKGKLDSTKEQHNQMHAPGGSTEMGHKDRYTLGWILKSGHSMSLRE